MKLYSSLQFITSDLAAESHAEQARLACNGGIRWIQLRMKRGTADERMQVAMHTRATTTSFNACLIINDSAHLAQKIGADGAHLGQSDSELSSARALLGPNSHIGGTANTLAEAVRALSFDVSYLGIGPFRFTSTKEELKPVLGLEGITRLVQQIRCLPQVSPQLKISAIGGIVGADFSQLRATGVDGVCVSSAVFAAHAPTVAAKDLQTEALRVFRGE